MMWSHSPCICAICTFLMWWWMVEAGSKDISHSTGRTAYPHILQKKEDIDLLMNQTDVTIKMHNFLFPQSSITLISTLFCGCSSCLKRNVGFLLRHPQIFKCLPVWWLWKWKFEHLYHHISLVHQSSSFFYKGCCPSCGKWNVFRACLYHHKGKRHIAQLRGLWLNSGP